MDNKTKQNETHTAMESDKIHIFSSVNESQCNPELNLAGWLSGESRSKINMRMENQHRTSRKDEEMKININWRIESQRRKQTGMPKEEMYKQVGRTDVLFPAVVLIC
jgi:predicted Rdx family selenoprotein